MSIAKPTKYPDWSVNPDGTDNDVTNPQSGQNNVVEPDAGKKLLGWDFGEKPPRQYFNWLARVKRKWIQWLDEQLMTADADGNDISTSFNMDVFSQAGKQVAVVARKIGSLVILDLQNTSGIQPSGTGNLTLSGGPTALFQPSGTIVTTGYNFEVGASIYRGPVEVYVAGLTPSLNISFLTNQFDPGFGGTPPWQSNPLTLKRSQIIYHVPVV
jgi:hypothetical protein